MRPYFSINLPLPLLLPTRHLMTYLRRTLALLTTADDRLSEGAGTLLARRRAAAV